MKLAIRAAFLCVFLLLAVAATASAEEDQGVKKVFWKTATLAPEGIGWAKHMTDLIFPEIERSTEGNVEIKVYWGGVMGDEEDYIRKIRIGQLDGAGLSAQGTVMACPEMAVLELPFLFRDYNEIDYLRVKMGPRFDQFMEKNGFFLIGWIDQDFDQIYSSKLPMATLEDFDRSRFITWYGPVEEAMLEALGAEIIPVNVPELPTAVRQKVADVSIGPAVWVVGAQLYSTVRYVNPVRIRYSPATIVHDIEKWKSLYKPYRREFYERRVEIGWKYTRLVRRDNEKYLQALIRYGVQRTDMAPEEVARLKEKTKVVWDQMAGSLFPRELLDEVLAHLEDYRTGSRLSLEDLVAMSRMDHDNRKLDEQIAERYRKLIKDTIEEWGMDPGEIVDFVP